MKRHPFTYALLPLLFFVVTLLCYWPAIDGALVWDDENLIAHNRWIKSPVLTGEMFRHWLQPESNAPYFRPIQTVTLALDYYIWGANTPGYHITNILLHASSGYLLFLLLSKLAARHLHRNSSMLPAAVALIWTVHPIHNAGVAYISGRADSLGMAFAVGAWLVAMRGMATVGLRAAVCWSAAGLLMLLALLSKEISIVWLGLFSIYALGFRTDVRIQRKIAMFVGALAVVAVWAWMRTLPVEPGASSQTVQTSWPQRAVLVTRAIGDYASLLVAPTELHMERTIWPDWYRHQISWSAVPANLGVLGLSGLLVIAVVIAACLWKAEGRPLRIVGAGWFALCFLPISNLFPLNAQVAEHWIYVASIGALIFAAGCWLALPQRVTRFAPILVVCWAVALAVRTNLRAAEWRDPVVFYQQTISAMGGTPRVFNNLGASLSARGRLEDAERVYRYAIERFPGTPALLSNLGTTLMKLERRDEADGLLRSAGQKSDSSNASDDRARSRSVAAEVRVQLIDKKPADALTRVRETRRQLPERWDLLKLEVEALVALSNETDAVAALESYLSKHWYSIEAHSMLARLSYGQGHIDKSLEHWRKAASLDVWDREPWSEMAKIEAERRNLVAACSHQKEAVERSPDDPMARLVLAKFLGDAGREVDAAVALMDARELAAKAGR